MTDYDDIIVKPHYQTAITGREKDLIVGYDMQNQDGFVINKEMTGAGGGSNGTIVDARQMFDRIHGNGLYFKTGVIYANLTADMTEGGSFFVTVRTEQRISGGGYIFYHTIGTTEYRIYIDSGNNLISRFGDSATAQDSGHDMLALFAVRITATWSASHFYLYVNGVLIDDYAATFTDSMSLLRMGATNSFGTNNTYDGIMYNPVFVSRFMNVSEVKADYLKYANRLQYKVDLDKARVSSADETEGYLSNTPFQIQSGVWRIVDATINGKKTKSVKCVTSGILYIEKEKLGIASVDGAYGSWDLYLKHQNTVNTNVHFMASTTDLATTAGYEIQCTSGEKVRLREFTGGGAGPLVTYSATSYAAINEWIRLRVERRYDGQFTIFYNNALMTPDAGQANPVTDTTVTSSDYVLFDFGTDDEISMISQKAGARP